MFSGKRVGGAVDWVGVLDPDIRVFDIIMRTEYGTTYNSYVVRGEDKTAVIDIVKDGFFDEFLERLRSVTDPARVDYIVVNHSEPDHTGSLFRLLSLCPNAQVVGTAGALSFLKQIVNRDFAKITARDNDSLDLGGLMLRFFPLPFLHWPDTMFTYLETYSDEFEAQKVLFTCDGFGAHFCDERIFNDLVPEDVIENDYIPAYKYYFDSIMDPFKPHVLKAATKVAGLMESGSGGGSKLDIICPGHGLILRRDLKRYVDLYAEWARPRKNPRPLVTVCYVSSYGYTGQLAERLTQGVSAAGDIEAAAFDLVADGTDIKAVLERIGRSDGLMFGTPTIVGDALPPVYELLARLNPIIHGGKLALAFGSYGWSGEGVPNIEQRMTALKFRMPFERVRVQFKPAQDDLNRAFEAGKAFGEELLRAANAKSCEIM